MRILKTLRLIVLGIFTATANLFALEQTKQPQNNIPLRNKVEFPDEIFKDPFKSVLPEIQKTATVVQEEYKEEVALPVVNIQGLIWGGKEPLAIINNKVYKVGDLIEDIKIINIEKEGVSVIYRGKNFVLPAPSNPKNKEDIY